jgi:uncharacterized membrane protein YedE/YeeE
MLASLLGGILIGLSAAVLLLGQGKVAGISGVVAGVLRRRPGDVAWRLWFLGGLGAGGLVFALFAPSRFQLPYAAVSSLSSGVLAIAAGLLVGFGTRLSGGCTSGHGVCGIGRFSGRSLIATITFMATGALTVFVVRHVLP